jgi:hypothetical protein
MRTSFSLLARETPRTCAVSAGEAKSVVMTALAIASSDNNRLSSMPSILMSHLASRFRRCTSAVEPAYSLVLVLESYVQKEIPKRFSTKHSYLSYINNHIRPRWERISRISTDRSKTVGGARLAQRYPRLREASVHWPAEREDNIRGLMHRIVDCAMLSEYLPTDRNPMVPGAN